MCEKGKILLWIEVGIKKKYNRICAGTFCVIFAVVIAMLQSV